MAQNIRFMKYRVEFHLDPAGRVSPGPRTGQLNRWLDDGRGPSAPSQYYGGGAASFWSSIC